MTPSLEGWPIKAKEAPPDEVQLTPLDTNPEFYVSGRHLMICDYLICDFI